MHDHDHNHHGHSHQGHHHGTGGTKLLFVIFANLGITLAEYIGGIFSGSLALISDAGHNFSDVLSLMLGYAGERVSEKNPSSVYTFGLKRFEVLIALVNAISLAAIGIFIAYEAVQRFINPQPVNISIMIPVALIGLAGNVISIILLASSKDKNLNMKAAFLHMLYDAVSSVAVIIAGVIIYFTGILWIDLAASLLIVFMIVWSSYSIIKQSIEIFLQRAPSHIDTDAVHSAILSVSGIIGVHGLHIWSINSNEVFLSSHILVDPSKTKKESADIIRKVNLMLEKKFCIEHSAIQIEFESICDVSGKKCCR